MALDGIVVRTVADGSDVAGIGPALAAEIRAEFGPRNEAPLSLLAHDRDGAPVGGLLGVTHWGWCYIRVLWVTPAWRSRGVGGRLLGGTEAEARSRECVGLYTDTFNPDAARFYERNGFAPVGEIAAFPSGHTRTFLARRLKAASIPK